MELWKSHGAEWKSAEHPRKTCINSYEIIEILLKSYKYGFYMCFTPF